MPEEFDGGQEMKIIKVDDIEVGLILCSACWYMGDYGFESMGVQMMDCLIVLDDVVKFDVEMVLSAKEIE